VESLAEPLPSELDACEEDEDEDAEVRNDLEGRPEIRRRVRIHEREHHRSEDDAREDLPDHGGLVHALEGFARELRGDEDDEKGDDEIHGRSPVGLPRRGSGSISLLP